jgi:diacylglycerol kinase
MSRKLRRTSHDRARVSIKRPAWRQRLIQAERGLSSGVRGDSTFFVHFFVCTIVLAAGAVIGLRLLDWALVSLALGVVLSAEMFNQVVKVILRSNRTDLSEDARKVLGISTAAVLFAIVGALVSVVLIFWHRAAEMFFG